MELHATNRILLRYYYCERNRVFNQWVRNKSSYCASVSFNNTISYTNQPGNRMKNDQTVVQLSLSSNLTISLFILNETELMGMS